MEFRLARIQDLESLVEGNQRMAQETESLALDPEILRSGIAAVLNKEVAGRYYVVTSGESIAGQVMITFEWSDWRASNLWWLQSVYVWPDRRRQGVFRALYEGVEALARREGAAGVRLYVEVENQVAQQVYTQLGLRSERYRVMELLFNRDSVS